MSQARSSLEPFKGRLRNAQYKTEAWGCDTGGRQEARHYYEPRDIGLVLNSKGSSAASASCSQLSCP